MPTRYAQARTVDTRLIVQAPYGGRQTRDTGNWPKAEGGGLEGEDVRYGEFEVATGNFTREDMTLRRPYDENAPELEKWLERNRGAAVTVVRSYRDDSLQPLSGVVKTYTGRIRGVAGPEADVTASERSELTVMLILDVEAG